MSELVRRLAELDREFGAGERKYSPFGESAQLA
jgi:hypothetical protein